jgi:hypothetical protein
MTVRESIVSPFPAGAGRKMDYTWPDWNANVTGNVTNQIRDRPGVQAANPAGSISTGTTGTIAVGVVNGVSCVRVANGAGTGPSLIIDGAGRLHFTTLSANVSFDALVDDYACTRVYMVARVTGTPAQTTDCGLTIVLGNNAGLGIISGAAIGWAYRFDTAGGVSFTQRGNSGALTSVPVATAAGGFVNTNYHKLEYRIVNATAVTNGLLKIFLDDQFQFQRSFASVPDDLPIPTTPGANISNGYCVNVQYQATNGEMDVALVRCQRGPSEVATVS